MSRQFVRPYLKWLPDSNVPTGRVSSPNVILTGSAFDGWLTDWNATTFNRQLLWTLNNVHLDTSISTTLAQRTTFCTQYLNAVTRLVTSGSWEYYAGFIDAETSSGGMVMNTGISRIRSTDMMCYLFTEDLTLSSEVENSCWFTITWLSVLTPAHLTQGTGYLRYLIDALGILLTSRLADCVGNWTHEKDEILTYTRQHTQYRQQIWSDAPSFYMALGELS